MIRRSSYILIAVLLLNTFASADLKIKTRTTVMGRATESTVYIKGARMRSEMSFGGRAAAVTLMQCDQKRLITISGNQCMVLSAGGGETSCPAMPNVAAMARAEAMGGTMPAARKGGVVTITRTANDTGERQDMFGYKARHVKSTMSTESSPDACNQSHMKMEIDGWYADLSAGLSCGDESYRAMACGGPGAGRGCQDRIVMKGSGAAAIGYPLKQTMTMTSDQGTFTTTTEVVELSSTTLDAPMFEMPAGCRVMDMSALTGGAAAPAKAEEPAPTPAAAPEPKAEPAAAPAAAVAPKAAGVVRIGVVKIKDSTGQSLPTDNLRMYLMSEFGRHQMEAIPLDAEAPQPEVESEARAKQCDYVVFTVANQVVDKGGSGLPAAALPKGVKLDPGKFQALSGITLYKVGKPAPEIKDLALAADADTFIVDAVMNTFVQESDRVAQQIADDAHPKPAAKAPTKPPAGKKKGN